MGLEFIVSLAGLLRRIAHFGAAVRQGQAWHMIHGFNRLYGVEV